MLENKTFFVKTFGCQMNVADSEQMSSLLRDQGALPAVDMDQADVVILNGCEVREKAVHKMLSSLGTLKTKSSNSNQIIGIGGCVGSLKGDQLFSRNPHLDFVFGTDTIAQLPELIHRVQHGEKRLVFNELDDKDGYIHETKVSQPSASVFVNIMKGCDKYCSYCIVPYTRGREKSRPLKDIVSDIERLALFGAQEVTLLGQNVNSYGKGTDETFPNLLRAVNRISGIKRIRFTSSHPMDFSDDLIACYGELENLSPHLHLPVQSGSNAVLQKMHRHYKIELFYSQIEKWKKVCPQGGLSTDLIVGFPSETLEDFQQTMTMIRDMAFDMVYAFAYSPRPGTKAAKLVDNVSGIEKKRRLQELLDEVVRISRDKNQRFIGTTQEVLVEGRVKSLQKWKDQAMWQGRTGSNHVVNFPYQGPRDLTGKFISLEIEGASGLALTGNFLPRDS